MDVLRHFFTRSLTDFMDVDVILQISDPNRSTDLTLVFNFSSLPVLNALLLHTDQAKLSPPNHWFDGLNSTKRYTKQLKRLFV